MALAWVALPLTLMLLTVAQALWVRARVPRLPEAEGPRQGRMGEGSAIRVLVAGESPAAGVGVDHQGQGLAAQMAAALAAEHGRGCEWRVEARSGLLARELPALLATVSGEWSVIVLVLGVNDAKALHSRRRFRTDLDRVAEHIRAHHPEARVLCCGIPPLNRFPALPWPLRTLLGWRSASLDRELSSLARRWPRFDHRPVSVRGDGDFARDGFHPGSEGYREWGQALARVIVEERFD